MFLYAPLLIQSHANDYHAMFPPFHMVMFHVQHSHVLYNKNLGVALPENFTRMGIKTPTLSLHLGENLLARFRPSLAFTTI